MPKKQRLWFAFEGAHFFSATAAWPLDAQAVYLRLLWHQFVEGAVPINDLPALCRICGASRREMKKILPLISTKFDEKGLNEKMSGTIAKMLEISEERSNAASKRWSKSNANASANASAKAMLPTLTHTHKKKVSKKPSTEVEVILPAYLTDRLWNYFLESRKKSKPTAHAKNLLLRKLDKLKDEGENPVAVVEQSIENGWKTFYPVRRNNQNARSNGKITNSIEGIGRFLDEGGEAPRESENERGRPKNRTGGVQTAASRITAADKP